MNDQTHALETVRRLARISMLILLATVGVTGIVGSGADTDDDSSDEDEGNPVGRVFASPERVLLLPGDSATIRIHLETDFLASDDPVYIQYPRRTGRTLPDGVEWSYALLPAGEAKKTGGRVYVSAAEDAESGTFRIRINGENAYETVPVTVLPVGDAVADGRRSPIEIAAGVDHSLAILDDGTVWSWGGNDVGQLGDGSYISRLRPVRVIGLPAPAVDIAAGDGSSIAVLSDGTVWGWGRRSYALGGADRDAFDLTIDVDDPPPASTPTPVQIIEVRTDDRNVPIGPVIEVAAGATNAAVRLASGEVAVWGWGADEFNRYVIPTVRSIPEPATSIAVGLDHTLALLEGGGVVGWGSNNWTQLGVVINDPQLDPDFVSDDVGFTQVAAGANHSLLRRDTGELWLTGLNNAGQIGDGTAGATSSSAPAGLSNVVQAAGGDEHSLALDADGNVWAWGSSRVGQSGDYLLSSTPNQLPLRSVSDISSVAANGDHSLALDTSCGQVLGWGDNDSHQLGNGATIGYDPNSDVVSIWPNGLPVFGFGDAVTAPDGCPLTLSVLTLGDGRGSVSFADMVLQNCRTDVCAAAITRGSTVTITARPASDSGLPVWLGDCSGDGLTIDVTMDRGRNCYVRFDQLPDTSNAPVARFSAAPNPATVGEAVTFDASASNDDGQIVSYEWDFDGDGTFDGSGEVVQQVYTQAGDFTAVLRVTDDEGKTDSAVAQITIRPAVFALSVARPPDPVSGQVSSSPAGIDCGDTCSADFDEGTVVTLTAIANQGAVFVGFGGDADCNDGEVTLDVDVSCTASFVPAAPTPRTLTVNVVDEGGTGRVTSAPAGIDCGATCSAQFADGTTVTLTATADPGSVFSGFGGDADCVDGEVTLTADLSCSATFQAVSIMLQQLTVTRSGSGSGNVTSSPSGIDCGATCTGVFPDGSSVTLTPVADPGSAFGGWSGDPDCTDGVLTMDATTFCDAAFDVVVTPTLTVTAVSGAGTIASTDGLIACVGDPTSNAPTGDCMETYSTGAAVTLEATPDAGWRFLAWGGDCMVAGTQPTVQVTLTEDTNCAAAFGPTLPPGTDVFLEFFFATPDSGTITSRDGRINCRSGAGFDCGELYTVGDTVVIDAVPDPGYAFQGWELDCARFGNQSTITLALFVPTTRCRANFAR